jgi:DNA-binding transcriptional ArsR family regulator
MIFAQFDTEALTRVRFAISPMIEMMASHLALEDPDRAALHMPWVEQARERTRAIDLSTLRALLGAPGYRPDFIHPPPSSPLVALEDELARMVATPGEQARAEVLRSYDGAPLPQVLEPFVSDPPAALERLAGTLREYWDGAMAAHWGRIRAVLEHDVLYRSRRMADGGTYRVFADLDPSVTWRDGTLHIDQCCDGNLELDERGLLLLPSVFVWPKVMLVTEPPWQPTLIYPARGVGMLWEPQPERPADALAKLIGRNRAALLLALDRPRSTSDLAGAFGFSNGGISQQLAVLSDAGLVSRRRVNRHVLYLRSCDGDALVQAASGA